MRTPPVFQKPSILRRLFNRAGIGQALPPGPAERYRTAMEFIHERVRRYPVVYARWLTPEVLTNLPNLPEREAVFGFAMMVGRYKESSLQQIFQQFVISPATLAAVLGTYAKSGQKLAEWGYASLEKGAVFQPGEEAEFQQRMSMLLAENLAATDDFKNQYNWIFNAVVNLP